MNVPKLDLTAQLKRCSSNAIIDLEIQNFAIICPKNADQFSPITSAPFCMGDNIGLHSEWKISVEGVNGYLGCYIELTSSPLNTPYLREGIRCKFSMNFGSSRNRFVIKCGDSEPMEGLVKEGSMKCGIKFIGQLSELYQKQKTLLENNTLRICIQLEIEDESGGTDFSKWCKKKCMNHLETLSEDLGQLLLTSRLYADISVKCGEQVFPCHKLILTARSKVFRAMFENSMSETGQNEIMISDMNPTIVQALLDYMYSGKVEKFTKDLQLSGGPFLENWIELLYGAEKYDLEQLKYLCFDEILKNITLENVPMVAATLQFYNADSRAKDILHKFCIQNIAKLMKNPGFKEILMHNSEIVIGNGDIFIDATKGHY